MLQSTPHREHLNLLRWLNNQPYLLLVLTALFWAGNAIAGKLAVGHISPFLLTSLRWLVALVILAPFAFRYLRSDWETVKPELLFLFILGSMGFAIFNNLMYLALVNTSAINVAIIQSSMPLFVFILNAALFSVRVKPFQAIGFPVTIIGVVIVTFQGSFSALTALQVNIGDGLMLAAVAVYGVYSVLLGSKPNIHWLSTMMVLVTAALITSIPFVLFESASGDLQIPDLNGLVVVCYAAVFASLLSQAFWIRSIELVGSNATSAFINLVPLFGTLLAVLILGERLQDFHVLGFLLIVIGIYIGQRKTY